MADPQPFEKGGVEGWRGVEDWDGGGESLEQGDEVLSCVSGELVQSIGSSSSSPSSFSSRFSDRGSRDRGRPESPAMRVPLPSLISFTSPKSLSSSLSLFVSPFTVSASDMDSSSVRTVFGADVRFGGGVHGSEWQRLCLLGWSPPSVSDAEGSSQSGGGGRVKVREMTDLLGDLPYGHQRFEVLIGLVGVDVVEGAAVSGIPIGGCEVYCHLGQKHTHTHSLTQHEWAWTDNDML